MTRSSDPRERMGVFKRWTDVPGDYRLQNVAAEYEGRDVWAEWTATLDLSDYRRETLERASRSWHEHMADRDRHHALARPVDVASWSAALLDGPRNVNTAYNKYWVQVEQFYTWLMYHVEHEDHRYQPFWMAAVEDRDGPTGRIWDEKTKDTDS